MVFARLDSCWPWRALGLLLALVAAGACASRAVPTSRSSATSLRHGAASEHAQGHAASEPSADVPPIDLWPAQVLTLLNEHRNRVQLAPLAPSAALSAIAQRAATSIARAELSDDEAMARAHAELERHALVYRRVAAVRVFADHPQTPAALPAGLDDDVDAGAAGVGAALAPRPAPTPGRAVVVLIVAALR